MTLAETTTAATGTLTTRDLGGLLDQPRIVRREVLGSWLREGGLALVYAPSGVGKSFLAMSAALAVAGGGRLLGWAAPEPRRVLYVDGEMDVADLQERFAGLLGSVPGVEPGAARRNLGLLSRHDQEPGVGFPDIAEAEGRRALLAEVDRSGAELVVLDNLSTLATIEDENAAGSFNDVVKLLMDLRTRGVAVVLVHHSRKASKGEGAYRGSQKLSVTFNAILRLEHPNGVPSTAGAAFVLHWEKLRSQRDDATRAPMLARLTEGGWTWEVSEDARLREVVAEMKSLRHASDRAMAAALGVPWSTFGRLKAKAVAEGLTSLGEWKRNMEMAREVALGGEAGEGPGLEPGAAPDF